jgi:hypothetical protein
MSNDEYENFDVVTLDEISDLFPWFTLASHDLLEKLELIYAADPQLSQFPMLPRSIVTMLKRNETPQKSLTLRVFENELTLPVLKEYLVVNENLSDGVLAKKTHSHRPLISALESDGSKVYHDLYLQNLDDSNVRAVVSEVLKKESINELDLDNYLKGKQTDPRVILENESIAVLGYYLALNNIGRNVSYTHGSNEIADFPSIIRKVTSALFYTGARFFSVANYQHLKEIEFIDNFIRNYQSRWPQALLFLQYQNIVTRPIQKQIAFPKNGFSVRMANVLSNYYSFLVPWANGYNPVSFIYEIMRGRDFGVFGYTLATILYDYDDKGDSEFYEIAKKIVNAAHGTGDAPIDKGQLNTLKSAYANYKGLLAVETINSKKEKTRYSRELKDQIYKVFTLAIFGVKRYNAIMAEIKKTKNSSFFDIVTSEESAMIEKRYSDALDTQKRIRTCKCKHTIMRNDYDTLPLNDNSKHKLIIALVDTFGTGQRTQIQNNNKQIICKHDGLVIACEHEIALARYNLAPLPEKAALFESLQEKFTIDDSNFDEGICKYCGRKMEESKTLIASTEFDSFSQPIMRMRASHKDTFDIEAAIIRAISKTEPLKGVDDLTQQMNAVFLYDDVRRISSHTDTTIMNYYSLIEQKRDSLERVYKAITKVSVIYSLLIYEAMTFRPESVNYFITPDHPWEETENNRTIEGFLKRAMFMIRLRFWNIANDANKISKTMLKDYMYKIYKRYIAEKASRTMNITSRDTNSGLFYRMTHTDIVSNSIKQIIDNESKIMAKPSKYNTDTLFYAKLFIDDYKTVIPKSQQEFIDFINDEKFKTKQASIVRPPRIVSVALSGITLVKKYLNNPIITLVSDYSAKVQKIKPVEYNKYGVKQKWEKIIIHYRNDNNDTATMTFNNENYAKVNKMYEVYFSNSQNADNILPDNFIVKNDSRIIKIDYENKESELKSALANEEYPAAKQNEIRTLIEKQAIIGSMYEYANNTQNRKFMKILKDTIKTDPIKGYIISDYESLFKDFIHELSLDNIKVATKGTRNNEPEETNGVPVKSTITSTIAHFKESSLQFINKLFKILNMTDKYIMNEYYTSLQVLGRKTIQEAQELDGYTNVSDYIKSLTREEIITIHTNYQIDRIKSYIKTIYQACNFLFYAKIENVENYNTTQGQMLIKYIGKIPMPINKIRKICKVPKGIPDIDKKLNVIYNKFIDLCTAVMTINVTAAQMIKEFIDTFISQDSSLNLDRRLEDYRDELQEAMNQFRYDKDRLRKKMSIFESIDNTQEVEDPLDKGIFYKNEIAKQSERMSMYRDYMPDIMRLSELTSDNY